MRVTRYSTLNILFLMELEIHFNHKNFTEFCKSVNLPDQIFKKIKYGSRTISTDEVYNICTKLDIDKGLFPNFASKVFSMFKNSDLIFTSEKLLPKDDWLFMKAEELYSELRKRETQNFRKRFPTVKLTTIVENIDESLLIKHIEDF